MTDPFSRSRKVADAERVDKVLGRKSGGRVRDDGETNITITINGTPKGEQTAPPDGLPALPPAPPMAPPPPPGGLSGLPVPPPAGPGPIGMRRGGRIKDAGAGSGVGRLQKA